MATKGIKKAAKRLKYKLIPDWSLPEGKSRQEGDEVRIHPHALISYTQKKWGIAKACQVAISLLKNKYHRVLEDSKVTF